MARIFDVGIDARVQSLALRRLRIPSPCCAAAAAFLSARISFQEAISKDDVLSVGSDPGEANHSASRLRIGSHRVLFMLEGDQIAVYAVKDRKEAYE